MTVNSDGSITLNSDKKITNITKKSDTILLCNIMKNRI